MALYRSIILIILLGTLLTGCAQTMHFTPSTIVPAASGDIHVKKDKNGNYLITVTTLNMAEANRLSPARVTYVVWIDSDGNSPIKLGQIHTSSGLLSKALKGELKATTTEKPTRVYITAEDNGEVTLPGSQQVLTT